MKIEYEKLMSLLEENFCKKCDYFNPTGGHWTEDGSCCTLEDFDKCLIAFLSGMDSNWDEEF